MLRFLFRLFSQTPLGRPCLCAALFLPLASVRAATGDTLALSEIQQIYTQAADRASEIQPNAVIAIVDRDGRALLVRRAAGPGFISAAETAIAVAKAGTAVFLSSNGEAFTTRTAAFIIQQNFPPRVLNRPPGPLVGVGFSNLAFSDINYLQQPDGSRIPGTRLYGSPGGVPLYKNGTLVAAIGVTGDGTEQEDASITGPDNDEAVALAGQIGFSPDSAILGSRVFIDGISLPYVESEARPASTPSGRVFDPTGVTTSTPVIWPTELFGGVPGQVRAPMRADPLAGTISGQTRLTEAEVRQIIANAAARTLVTRGGIRLPAGQPTAVFITVVNNPAQAGVAPSVLGTFRTPDATIFSWDVAIQKARTAVFFSNNSRAFSTRTVGFLAQSMYPPGLANQPAGPFNGLQERFALPLLSGTAGANPNLPNGITIFAGGFPLYRNGVLIGAIGVSGDGIDQDDLIAASGTAGFLAPEAIRADNMSYLGARLPYAKFPRDAELRPNVDPITSLPVGFQGLTDSAAIVPGLTDLSTQLGGAGSTTTPASSTDASATIVTPSSPQGLLPFPAGIAVDGAGNLYISDLSIDSIKKVSPNGLMTTLAGGDGQSGSADGPGATARFNDPSSLTIALDGTLSIADTGNATLRRVTAAGVVTTFAGSAAARGNVDANGTAATFSAPLGLAQAVNGTLYVADAMNNTIRRITTAGVVSTFAGSPGSTGDINGTGTAARFNHPTGLALDTAGNLYVADSINNTIRKISPTGNVSTLAGLSGVSGSQNGSGNQALFNNPGGLAIDASGNLYVADTGNSCIRLISPAGVVTTYAGLPGVAGFKNGTGVDVWFNQPRGVALDASGNLFVADTANSSIRKITPAGTVSALVLTFVTPPLPGTTPPTTTPPATSNSGGGGGAPSAWFIAALSFLLTANYAVQKKKRY